MAAGSAVPGLFFSFAATVLLVIVSVSVPIWKSVSFLHASDGTDVLTFGNWGICAAGAGCTAAKLGYDLDLTSLGIDASKISSILIHRLTYVLILNPIAAGLAALAFLFGLLAVFATSRISTILMFMATSLALLVSAVVWIFEMVIFAIARNRIRNLGNGASASLGNALWIGLGAFVALLIGSCVSCLGSFGRFRSSRAEKY